MAKVQGTPTSGTGPSYLRAAGQDTSSPGRSSPRAPADQPPLVTPDEWTSEGNAASSSKWQWFSSRGLPREDGKQETQNDDRGQRFALDMLLSATKKRRKDSDFNEKYVDEIALAHFQDDYVSDFDAKGYGDDALGRALMFVHDQKKNTTLSMGNTDITKQEEESRFALVIDKNDEDILVKEAEEQAALKKLMVLDLVSGAAVIANGAMLGLQVDGSMDEDSVVASWLDQGFLLFFILEWLFRWFLNPEGLRGMLVDRWTRFDCFVISVSLFDFMMTFIGAGAGTKVFAVFRVVRLLRLIRLVRLLKLLKELWLLVQGMMTSIGVLFWSVVLLVLVCYIFGILLYELVGKNPKMSKFNEYSEIFGSLGRSMFTLMKSGTLEGYGDLSRLITQGDPARGVPGSPMVFLVLLVVVATVALSILNLIVGVLLTAAL
jgi:hypothetical protein